MGTLLMGAITTLVFCAPGYPGTAQDAQPLVDGFAAATAAAAGWPTETLSAVYDATEDGGLARLAKPDAAIAFVPFPFYVKHAAALHLTPVAQALVAGVGAQEQWTLVAKAGRNVTPASLAGYTLESSAGYAAEFVRGFALRDWPLPPDVKIAPTSQVLSTLRRVAAGDPVVVLLDQQEAAALSGLPFAAELHPVAHSALLPVALVVSVDARLPKSRLVALRAGLLALAHRPGGADMLAGLRLQGFQPPDLPRALSRDLPPRAAAP